MKPITPWTAVLAACGAAICSGQTLVVQPQIAGRVMREGQVTTVYLAPRFATAIRMPDAINSVVLGDPESFSAEHSDREPQVVFVKPITTKPAQTNVLILTARGYEANVLLISRGEAPGTQQAVDFLMRYRPAGRFLIEPSIPSGSVAETKPLEQGTAAPHGEKRSPGVGQRSADSEAGSIRPVSFSTREEKGAGPASDTSPDLEGLLERQRRAPLPVLYGERPGIAPPGNEILKAGVSEVIDQGKQVVVLFSAVNMQDHAVELMPPQVQLAGKVKKGVIVRHKVWSNSEQLPVAFRLSRRRVGPGERADGVLVFERPAFKQSNETLLLQIADSGAVDRPALAPIGFGISSLRREGGE